MCPPKLKFLARARWSNERSCTHTYIRENDVYGRGWLGNTAPSIGDSAHLRGGERYIRFWISAEL